MVADIKITITNEDGEVLNWSTFNEYRKEAVASDKSFGLETTEADITLLDFADMVKDSIMEEGSRLAKRLAG